MAKEKFPDGTLIDEWFYDCSCPQLENCGKQYCITDYGVFADGKVYTEQIQKLIDSAAQSGGGVIVVPNGTYLTGALFFRQGVNLYLAPNAILKGSDDISDYPVCETRIEGETCLYYPAIINVDGVDGFVVFGGGIIDGNGLKAWKAFWQRRKWNENCTNKDEQRPRLLYISNSKNVTVFGVRLQNSPFWTSHIYKCSRVKFIDSNIFAPRSPVPAPSSDAIDIDACSDVLIKRCYMEVNDDAVVLKGGKGPWADEDQTNGANERVLVEDCEFGFCHSALTLGSECVHSKNILVRRIKLNGILQLLHLKLRPDTPQLYEYITVEQVEGRVVDKFINVSPWTQFFDLKGREDKPISIAQQIKIKDCNCTCDCFFSVVADEKNYRLRDFTLENIKVKTRDKGNDFSAIEGIALSGVEVQTE